MPYLHWLTRDEDLSSSRKAPYRLLEAVPEHSAGDAGNQNCSFRETTWRR